MIVATVVFILIGTFWNAYIISTYKGEAIDKYALFLGSTLITIGLLLLLIS